MKRSIPLSILILLSLALSLLTTRTGAQEPGTTRVPPAASTRGAGVSAQAAPQQRGWQYGPPSTFQYQRFDGAFVPGPVGEPWANKVYFMGGRIAAPSENPSIWMFDPVTGLYTDTQTDMIEDVSNYNANLVLDDGAGLGPAIYVVGGYDKDGGGGGGGLGLVQRYYPQYNYIEALPPEDNWPGQVAGYTVSGMGSAVVDDVIYVFGGWESNVPPYFYTGTWALDPSQPPGSRWTDLGAPLNTGRCYIQSAVQDGKIYAMGGVAYYDGSDLGPTAAVEVLDTAQIAAGWQSLAPMPVAVGEGRGFGFDDDTYGLNQLRGRLYVVGGGDWPSPGAEVMEYWIAADTWNVGFPDLNVQRVNHAGVYIPLHTPDPHDGLPGMWVFGGRDDDSCDPPYGPTEFYALPFSEQCSILLVDDDWDQYSGEPYNGTGTAYYTSTLEALGYAYDRWDVWTQGDPSLADLENYDVVIWFNGYAWDGTITETNEADLAAYLEGGGNLLVSSEDYLYDRGFTPFGAEYLGIGGAITDTGEVDLIGNIGDPIGNGLGPYTLTVPTSWPVGDPTLYTDEIFTATGTLAPFRYQAGGANNSTDQDRPMWRTVFLAWPLEGLDNLGDRMAVLDRVLNWFCFERPAEMSLEPPEQSGGGAPGLEVTYTLTLTNRLGFADLFAITYGSAWPIAGPNSIVLDDDASQSFVVTVTVPADSNCGDMDTAAITASASVNPAVYTDAARLHTTSEAPGDGALSGTVLDANTGLGIPGAHVFVSLGAYYTETLADAEGDYLFPALAACRYAGGADATRYYPTAFTVEIAPAMTTTLDPQLAASLADLSPDAVSVLLPAESVYTYPMTLTNLGTGDLVFTITEAPTDSMPWLDFAPTGGTIPPGDLSSIVLTLDSAGLPPETCFTGTLLFEYNDPYTMAAFLPVTMCVEAVPPTCDPPESFDFAWSPVTPTTGQMTTFTATVAGTPTMPLTYTWDFGDSSGPIFAGPVVTHTYAATGTYTVSLLLENPCYHQDRWYTLTVEESPPPPPEFAIYLPIVFKGH